MAGNKGEQLRSLFERQARVASDESIRSGGQVSAEQLERLVRLGRLIELHEAAQPRRRRRWPIIAVLGSTLALVSVLLFARVSETEIALNVALSEADLVLLNEQPLTQSVALSDLGASGLREIWLPRASDRDEQTRSSDYADIAVQLSVASDGNRPGTLNLAPVILPRETRVRVRPLDASGKYRLSLTAEPFQLRAEVNGPVRVGFSDARAEQLSFVPPNAVLLRAGTNELVLDLLLADSSRPVFSQQLFVRDLTLSRVDELGDGGRTLVRRVSSILSGNIIFESLGGEQRTLRSREMLFFEALQGEIGTMRLLDDKIELNFHGRVAGISVGSDESRRNLMPTWLEWLRARHSLSIFWATSLYLFGLSAGVLRWWKGSL